ncbi:MFS transporter [Corynebacterium sp. 4HC-13]|uniref:MFS transporter n=2 Tax=Corynebacterium anserum TaxID=2684406 RepID=A0A7G7YQX5_9CORY|nr:MFS transporter [Corynebacterium anserum]QNH96895.1 MFS transporter [Corynebacterium anserum]
MVWLVGVLLYTMAVTGRTSFGVASVEAMDQFHIDAARLAVFATLQLGTYSLAQIPVGLMVDRFGPRKLLAAGALVMALGQIVLAFSANYYVALCARILVGAGDATAFSSVMRIIPAWIPLKWTPLLSQLTGAIGQFGQFLSAVPFMMILHAEGWTVAFLSLGAVGALFAIVAMVAVQDTPDSPNRVERKQLRQAQKLASDKGADQAPDEALDKVAGKASTKGTDQKPGDRQSTLPIRGILVTVLRSSVCWHGFFIHWVGLGTLVLFTMLWGLPIMTLGMGLSNEFAGYMLTVATIATVLAGPVVGYLSARVGKKRWVVTLTGSTIAMMLWIWLFISPDPRGSVAAVVVCLAMGVFAPVSNLGFDSVREQVDRSMVATGTGLANMGGWTCGMITAQVVGVILSVSAPHGDYAWSDFRLAWMVVVLCWMFGVVGVVLTRPRRLPREESTTVAILPAS